MLPYSLSAISLLAVLPLHAAPVLSFRGRYAQSFDALPATGTLTLVGSGPAGTQAPVTGLDGWQAARLSGTATSVLTLSTSPSTTGRLYSYGLPGSNGRSLGSLASGSTAAGFGIALINDTSETWDSVEIQFVRELWTLPGTSTTESFPDGLRFAWGIDSAGADASNFLSHPALIPLPDLDATCPESYTLTGVAGSTSPNRYRDGTALEWSLPVHATLPHLQWRPGQSLFLRWTDTDDPGFDAGIAIDDLLLTASATPPSLPLELLPAPSTSSLRLKWPTLPGSGYDISESTQLATWSPLSALPLRATGSSLQAAIPIQSGSRFYKVQENLSAPPGQEVLFSAPGPAGTEEDLTIENRIRQLLEQAPAGSIVRGAIYTWTRETMSAACIEAVQRGVDLRLVIGSDHPAVDLLLAAIPERITICRDADGTANGCQGGRINHNKFLLFSVLGDGSTNVIVQSSANFTGLQLTKANNAVIVRNDASLYASYLQYWKDLASRPPNLNYYRSAPGTSSNQVWFFPNAAADGTTGQGDPIVNQLNAIDPAAGGEIHITMAFWSSLRAAIAQRLASLQQAGMSVHVITDPNETSATILQILRQGGVAVHSLEAIHSKYLLIDATLGGQRQRLVLTGSHNYTGPALRENDETLLRLDNPRLYDAFLGDWRRLRAHPLTR